MKSDFNSNTNLLSFINQCIDKFQIKLRIFQTRFSISIFIFFLGFICGNLFGTFLIFFRRWLPWDGFIILLTILTIEWINYLYFYVLKFKPYDEFQLKTRNMKSITFYLPEVSRQKNENYDKKNFSNFHSFIHLVNFYKLGLLLGFFIDAFKVGS